MEITIEAIEEDLRRAEATLGRPEAAIHMQRAQVRATLLALESAPIPAEDVAAPPVEMPASLPHIPQSSIDVAIVTDEARTIYVVPVGAVFEDRLVAAASLLAIEADVLQSVLHRRGFEVGGDPLVAPLEAPAEPVDEDDDFFAEARKERDA